MSDPLDGLRSRILRSIEKMELQLHSFAAKIGEHQNLKESAVQRPRSLCRADGNIMLHIGVGWFVEKTPAQVVEYADRRIGSYRANMAALEANLVSARKALRGLEKLEEDGTEEESTGDAVVGHDIIGDEEPGFPFMEIKEVLDEEGNVVTSSVEPQHKDHELKAFAEEHLTKIIGQREAELTAKRAEAEDVPKKPVYGPERPPHLLDKKDETTGMKNKNNVQRGKKEIGQSRSVGSISKKPNVSPREPSPVEKMGKILPELYEPSESESQLLIDERSGSQKSTYGSSNAISTEELLELQLITNEFDEEDYEQSNEDYSIDADEEDDDEDEEEDEYGRTRGTLFPFLPRRPEVTTKVESENSDGKKRVRFSEQIDIKTFETDPSERLNLNFVTREVDHAIVRRPASTPSVGEAVERESHTAEPVTSAIMERTALSAIAPAAADEPVTSDVIEREISSKHEFLASDEPKGKASLFKLQRKGKETAVAAPSQLITKPPATTQHNPPTSDKKRILKQYKPVPLAEKDTTVYYGVPENVLAEGSTALKISPDIYELAKENFRKAILTEEEFIKAHDDGNDDPVDQDVDESQLRSVLADSIVEHERALPEEDEVEVDMNFNVSRREIADEYQRLRRNLINRSGGFGKSQLELEVESIDEDGNPVKVSRFKAARLSNRLP